MEQTARADERARHWIETWSRILSVDAPARLERTSRWSVSDSRGRRGCSLVGVVLDQAGACIYHTRGLTQEDVVHELLHVARPAWPEAAVIEETERLLGMPRVLAGYHVSDAELAAVGRELLARSAAGRRRQAVRGAVCSEPAAADAAVASRAPGG